MLKEFLVTVDGGWGLGGGWRGVGGGGGLSKNVLRGKFSKN